MPVRDTIRKDLLAALSQSGVRASPQALTALVETVRRVPAEITGDTDGILTGLLYSGSYTVDLLEQAGANPALMKRLARDSVQGLGVDLGEPIESLFFRGSAGHSAVLHARADGGVLESRHLVEASLSLATTELYGEDHFPSDLLLEWDACGRTQLQRELEAQVADLIAYAVSALFDLDAPRILRERRDRISEEEDEFLDKYFGKNYRGMTTAELEFIVDATNAWFVSRRLLTDPADVAARLVARCRRLLFGPEAFIDAGGNIKAIDLGLQTVRRVAPEREFGGLALFERNGQVSIGQYSYRNTFHALSGVHSDPGQRVHLRAVRPVSLIPEHHIVEFERLLSARLTKETDIQRFLVRRPGFLRALGYANVRPHLCLYDPRSRNAKMIPDFILELPGMRGFDILDLKLPSAPMVVEHPYVRMSHDLTKALAQLRAYRRFFDDSDNRRRFEQRYGLQAFRPELTVVIGRNASFQAPEHRAEVEAQLDGLRLLTYDDVIAYARERVVGLPRPSGHDVDEEQ